MSSFSNRKKTLLLVFSVNINVSDTNNDFLKVEWNQHTHAHKKRSLSNIIQ